MKPETRVVVEIKHPEQYARDCAASLNGKRGTVERTRVDYVDGLMALVNFDTPAKTWWANQSPAIGFWFPVTDLRSE